MRNFAKIERKESKKKNEKKNKSKKHSLYSVPSAEERTKTMTVYME